MGAHFQFEPSDFTGVSGHRDLRPGDIARFFVALDAHHLPVSASVVLVTSDLDEIRQALDELRSVVDALDPAIGNRESVHLPFRLRAKPSPTPTAPAPEDPNGGGA